MDAASSKLPRVAPTGPFPLCSPVGAFLIVWYPKGMLLAIFVGSGAFLVLAAMTALLWLADREAERNDSVTQEIIIKANTAPVTVNAPATQKEKDNAA